MATFDRVRLTKQKATRPLISVHTPRHAKNSELKPPSPVHHTLESCFLFLANLKPSRSTQGKFRASTWFHDPARKSIRVNLNRCLVAGSQEVSTVYWHAVVNELACWSEGPRHAALNHLFLQGWWATLEGERSARSKLHPGKRSAQSNAIPQGVPSLLREADSPEKPYRTKPDATEGPTCFCLFGERGVPDRYTDQCRH